MKKIFFSIFAAISLIALSIPALATSPAGNSEQFLPEKAGTYNVPGRPDLKLRVFVHNVKPEKPGKPEPPSSEVCGLADNNLAGDLVAYAGWKLPASVSYWLNSASTPSSVGSVNADAIAQNSFNAFSAIAGVEVSKAGETTINKATQDGKWIVTWGRASASTLGVTYIWYNPATEEVVELDTILNQKYLWKWSDPASWTDSLCAYTNAYDAQNILTHEIGHWFGLDDHYTDAYVDHTMYGYGSKQETKKDTLTAGDIAGLEAIY